MTWEAIGRELNISPQAAQRICARGLQKLKARPQQLATLMKLAAQLQNERAQQTERTI